MGKAYWNSECNHLLNEETKERWIKRVAPQTYPEFCERVKARSKAFMIDLPIPTFEKYCELSNTEYKTPYEQLVDRTEHVKAMNLVIRNMNDETAYMSWINWVPDRATELDCVDVADDDELFDDVCAMFRYLIRDYGKHGFYFGGTKAYGERKK